MRVVENVPTKIQSKPSLNIKRSNCVHNDVALLNLLCYTYFMMKENLMPEAHLNISVILIALLNVF